MYAPGGPFASPGFRAVRVRAAVRLHSVPWVAVMGI